MTGSIGATVATRTQTAVESPRALVKRYEPEFGEILPSHVNARVWVTQVMGALKRSPADKQNPALTQLEVAARNNPAAFINTLRVAAGYGLMPGTPEFYLTPRPVNGRMEILGIVGYQGYVELMYRAGAIENVIVEVVHRDEPFMYRMGRDVRPIHDVDWTVPSSQRGDLWLVYAYATMRGGATSQVIVLDEDQIAPIRAKSASYAADIKYHRKSSPWHTDTEAMWKKSALRQLQKWVPTSAEFITAQLRAMDAAGQPSIADALPTIPHPGNLPDEVADGKDVYADDETTVDAEVVPPADAERDALIAAVGEKFTRAGLTDAGERLQLAQGILDREDAAWPTMTVEDYQQIAQWLDQRHAQREASGG